MFRKAIMILTCAASVTFVAAQFPWDTGIGDYTPSGETPSSDASSNEYDYDAGLPEGSEEVTAEAFGSEDNADEKSGKDAKAKPKKERAPRTFAAGFKSQKSCPVCNSVKIKKSQYAEHGGQRIHTCSAACKGRVKRNPDAFVKILQSRGEKPE